MGHISVFQNVRIFFENMYTKLRLWMREHHFDIRHNLKKIVIVYVVVLFIVWCIKAWDYHTSNPLSSIGAGFRIEGLKILESHFVYFLGYILYRYIRWAMKTIQTEKRKEKEIRRDTMNAIAHEVRTPLAALLGYAENIKLGVCEEKNEYYLDQIFKKGYEMNEMVNDILALARLEEGKQAMVKETVSVRDVIHETCVLHENERFVFHEETDWKVEGDPEYLKRMIRCLMDNAVKYRFAGSDVEITIQEKLLKIHNICEPLTEEQLSQMFMFRVNADGRYSYGLYYAKKAAALNGLCLSIYNDTNGVTAAVFE